MLGGRKAQAFSHFTVHESGGQLCICDLQGVGGSLFTDPQIHSKGGGFGDGNLGSGGIASFLQTHQVRFPEATSHVIAASAAPLPPSMTARIITAAASHSSVAVSRRATVLCLRSATKYAKPSGCPSQSAGHAAAVGAAGEAAAV